MKSLILLVVCALATAASADTVTLGADACSLTRQCLEVPNDAALNIDLYAAPAGPHVILNVDGVSYSGPSSAEITGVALQDSVGNIVYLTATFTSYKTCTRSGRGQTCSTHWSLVGGTLVR